MPKPNLLASFTNAKTRTFVLVFGAILIIGIGIAISRGGNKKEDILSKQGTQAAGVPNELRATPGSAVSEKYRELQVKENARRAEEATQKKTSAIPTIIGAISETNKDNADAQALENALKKQQDANAKLQIGQEGANGLGGGFASKSQQEKDREELEARLKAQRDELERQKAEQERQRDLEKQRQLALQQKKEYEAKVQQMASKMASAASGAYTEWTRTPNQSFVQGEWATKKNARKNSDGDRVIAQGGTSSRFSSRDREGKPIPKRKQVFIKAGSILFGIVNTAINTDEPGPVLATIVSGKYNGGKLIGNFSHPPQQPSVTLNFSQMTLPKRSKTLGVSVVAVDPETARVALASSVDRHLFLRYGMGILIPGLLQGYGQAISQQGSSTTISPVGVTTTQPTLDNKQIWAAAWGQVGTQMSAAMKQYFNTPYTVTIEQGSSVGLLFLSDVDVSDEEG